MSSAPLADGHTHTASRLTYEQRAALRACISQVRLEELRRKARTHRVCLICDQLVYRGDFPAYGGQICLDCLGLNGGEA
jgi:hypothetical protein